VKYVVVLITVVVIKIAKKKINTFRKPIILSSRVYPKESIFIKIFPPPS
jgi:hypothetical protein